MKQVFTVRMAGFAVAAVVVALDQLSKFSALDLLQVEGASRHIWGWLDATLVFNRSNAFGVVPVAGEISRWGLVAFNVAAAAGLVWWLVRAAPPKATCLGIGFLIGGALGNAIDRARLGVVVDFLDLSRIGFHWVFNLADACVDVGIGCLLLGIATSKEPENKSPAVR